MSDTAALKEKLLKLSNDIHEQHKTGQGTVRLADLAFLLSMPLDAQQEKLLAERGSVDFKATSPEGGVFENKGEAVSLQLPMATLIVPLMISGKYKSAPNSLQLEFDMGKTLSGKKGFINAPLEKIAISESKLNVRVGGMLGGMLSRDVNLA